LESLVPYVNFGKRVDDFGWGNFVDKEIVGEFRLYLIIVVWAP